MRNTIELQYVCMHTFEAMENTTVHSSTYNKLSNMLARLQQLQLELHNDHNTWQLVKGAVLLIKN